MRFVYLIPLALLSLIVFAGCGESDDDGETETGETAEPEGPLFSMPEDEAPSGATPEDEEPEVDLPMRPVGRAAVMITQVNVERGELDPERAQMSLNMLMPYIQRCWERSERPVAQTPDQDVLINVRIPVSSAGRAVEPTHDAGNGANRNAGECLLDALAQLNVNPAPPADAIVTARVMLREL